jgi:hypothetical protein
MITDDGECIFRSSGLLWGHSTTDGDDRRVHDLDIGRQ